MSLRDRVNENAENKELLTYMIGSFVVKIITLGMFFYIAQNLSQAEVGQIEIFNTNVNLIVPLISIQLGEACIRYLGNNLNRNKEYVTNIIAILIVQVVLMSIFLIFSNNKMLLVACLFTILNNFIALYSRSIGEFKYFRLTEIIQKSLLSILVVIFIKKGVDGYIYATIISLISALFIIGSRIIKKIKIDRSFIKKEIMLGIIKYVSPLIINAIGWWLITSTDRYIIRYFYTDAEVGIYAVATKIAGILMLFLQNIYYVYQKRYINSFELGLKVDEKYNTQYFKITIAITMISLCIPKRLLLLVLGTTFEESVGLYYLFVPSIMYWSLAVLYGLGYLMTKKTKGASATTLISAVVNIIINFILVKQLGIEGAIIATLISLFIWFLLRYLQQKDVINFKIPIVYWVAIIFIQVLSIVIYYIV